MYKIAICDDDKRYRKTIREIVEHENSLPENEIRFYEYESGNELLKHTDILHELVFIDIRMPGLDGNQTALKLRNYNKDAVLIFYSSYFEPTVDSINFGQPFRYIMKDLHDTSLRREIEAIMTEVKRRFLNDYAVTVTSAGKIIRIHVENILYVSRAKRGCVITIVKEQEKETVRCREAFGELCEQLKDQGFAQAHYSYIVNLEKVEGLERGVLRLKCGIELNVSRANSVMKPGGILLIIETVEDVPDILITQSFMMTEPKDQRKATNTMFLNRKQWLEILEENGFCNSEEFPGYGEYLEVLGQKLFYCTKE